MQYSGVISKETQVKIEKVIQTYIQGNSVVKLLRETIPSNLPFFWYESEIFENRDQLGKVNKELKAFMCKKKQLCQEMSGQTLYVKIRHWTEKRDAKLSRTRKKKIAEIIWKASGLQNRNLTALEAEAIILQWRDNNIFKNYHFKENHPMYAEITDSLNVFLTNTPTSITEKQSSSVTELPIETISVKDQAEKASSSITQSSSTSVKLSAEALKINSIITAFFAGKSSPVPISEKLPLFMDDAEVYKKRNETDHVNVKVKEFLCNQKEPCDGLSPLQLINAIYWWVWKEGEEKKKTRSKEVAEVILSSSGLTGQEVSEDRASAIIQQWRNNNIFKGYQFNEPKQIPTETTASLNENQSSTTTPVIRLKKGEGIKISQSSMTVGLNKAQPNLTTELPIDTNADKESIPASQNPNTYEKMYADFMEKINSIITAFLEGKPTPVPTSEKLPAHWYDGALEVYEKQNETQHVNNEIKKFLCTQKVPCDGLSPLQLITAIEGWIRKEGKEIEKTRIIEIAELILTSSGLTSQTLSDFQANAIFLQWRNNNIFKDYTFGPIQFSGSVDITNSELMETTSETRLHSYGVLPSEIAKTVNKMHGDYFDKQPLTLSIYEPLVPFWYDFTLYQKRNETDKANEAVDQFLDKQEDWSDYLPYQPTAVVAHEWVNDEQTDVEILARKEQLAPIILEGYGIRCNLTATEAVNTVLQWENNNVFKDYTFIELKQSSLDESQFRNETLTENSEMKRVPDTVVDSDLELVHKIVGNVAKNVVPATRYAEPLPIFYYHLLLFQKRNETSAVNKKMQEFFTKEGIAIKESSSDELEKATRQWLEKESTNSASNASERKQFLASFLLKAYGMEDFRFGEFLSSIKVQAILNQWKANTLLEGYTYQEITYTTIHHQSSKAEAPSVFRLKEQKKESQQIYADFIHDRTPTISKDQPLQTIYYHRTLFEKREKTSAVNELIRKFLLEQKVALKDQSASELVRGMQKWIFEGITYEAILAREKQVAQLLQKAYGLEEKELTVKEICYLLLQWENNNAQMGYSYKDPNTFEAIEINTIEVNEEKKERVEAFTRENKAGRPRERDNKAMEVSLSNLTEEQKEELLKKIVAFLGEKNIEVNVSKPNELVVKAARWAIKEVEGKETTDFTKVKMLANIILGKKEDAVISKEKAQAIFTKWLLDTSEEEAPTFTSTELIKEETTQTTQTTQAAEITTMQPSASGKQTPKYEAPNWRDKNMRIQVAQFFRQEGILKEGSTTENILLAMGKWFTEERGEMILSYNKLQSLSKVILKELDLYGGEGNETISDKDARLTIMKWVTENILGSSMEGYMLKKILDSPNPSEFTIGNLRKLFETEALINFSTFRVSKEELTIVQKLWSLFLKEVLPNYFLETSTLADELPISNYDSLMQLTGAKLLADLGIQTQFNQAEIQNFGTFVWDKISENGIKRVEELRYTILPAILAVAQLDPDLLREALKKGNYHEVALSTFIEYHQNGYFQLKEHQDTLYNLFTAYQKEALAWRRKQALAEGVAQKCLDAGLKSYTLHALTQNYLNGLGPCYNKFTPPNLEEWYTGLTKAVSDTFYPLDQKLIEFALKGFDLKEREFIFSLETELYEASAELEHIEHTSSSSSFKDSIPFALLNELKLEQTDLFVAIKKNEERWYALKKLEGGAYTFYRVDKDLLAYFKYGLLNHKEIWNQRYKKEGTKVRIGKRYFRFITRMDKSKKLPQGEETQPLIDAFSRKHSDTLYEQLYKSGNDQSISDQVWDVAKHFIPFYDCVTGLIEQDFAGAAPSCIIDVVLLMPVLGQVTSLSTRFALGMAKSMATGGIRNAIRQGGRFLPKGYEIKSVLTNIRQYIDPGIEAVMDGSKFIIRGLIDFKNDVWVGKKVKQLLERMANLVKELPSLPNDMVRAKLPGNDLEVLVKRMEDESYRRVTELETRSVYGGSLVLKGDRLERVSGPVSFTEEQKALINRLTKEIDPDQIFAVEPNVNPKIYGSGEVLSVSETGKETKHFITMNKFTIPVRETAIEGHGVRYDVVDGEKIYPVNFNGKEWYFDVAPFVFVSKGLADKVMKKIDEFESIKDVSVLSAPDERGLMWHASGRSYIKIYDHYIPLIQLNKNGNKYHLVKKDVNAPTIVLIFDPEIGEFRLKVSLDKVQQKVKLPKYRTLPDSPGRAEEWNEFRNVKTMETEGLVIRRTVDDTVPMDPITKFIPEARAIVYKNEKEIKEAILEGIIESLPRKSKKSPYDFRIYNTLDLNKAPNFLKPFLKDLATDYKKALGYFETALGVCEDLLTEGRIAGTPQGQYLIKMFRLEEVGNPEPILLEAVNRLASTSKKGVEFLQKTADWGFENILIASTDLVKKKGTQKYYSLYEEFIESTGAVLPNDPECRIVFLADAFHLNPIFFPDVEVKLIINQVIIHESTHIVTATTDFMKYTRVKGDLKSGKVILEEYEKRKSEIIKTDGFYDFVIQIAFEQKKPKLSRKTVWKESERNDLLRVNIQMIDAEMLTVIIRDFAEGRNFEGVRRVTRSSDEKLLGDGLLFAFSALKYIYGSAGLVYVSELNKDQEQPIYLPDITNQTQEQSTYPPDLTSTATSGSGNRDKREVVSTITEITESEANQIFYSLVNTNTENSRSIHPYNFNQQVRTKLPKTVSKRRDLNLVITNIENENITQVTSDQQVGKGATKPTINNSFSNLAFTGTRRSTEINSMIANQQVNKNLKTLAPQR
ncbi:MAG: QWxxN domain [Enterococcus sp.]